MDLGQKEYNLEEIRKKYKKFLEKNPQTAFSKKFYNYFDLFAKDFTLRPPRNAFEGIDINGNPFGNDYTLKEVEARARADMDVDDERKSDVS